MRNKKCLIITILWLGMILMFNNSIISAGTIIVDASGNGDYLTITDGMTASSSGDTVYVMPGTYYEHGIRMKENVVLQGAGADKCIIDGGDKHLGWPDNTVIFFDSVKVGKIDGFSINYKLGVGITLNQSTPIISNNKIINSGYGIYYHGSHPIECYPFINGNTITNNRLGLYFLLYRIDYSKVDTMDVSNNCWGTTVESEIQEGILDLNPRNFSFYKVIYESPLFAPVTSVKTFDAGIHLNNIYDNKEKNLCIFNIYGLIE